MSTTVGLQHVLKASRTCFYPILTLHALPDECFHCPPCLLTMAPDTRSSKPGEATEVTPLIMPAHQQPSYNSSRATPSSAISVGEQHLGDSGERLPYNDYPTIDWLQDLVKDNKRLPSRGGIRDRLTQLWDSSQGWIAAFLIGLLTAGVAAVVDDGYYCRYWKPWSGSFGSSYAIYVGLSLIFGIVAGSVTMTTKANLSVNPALDNKGDGPLGTTAAKTMYMAAGSGIPEIKTVLSGFIIPHIFDLKVLVVKAIGATFAVATGMCLGKEGPFVHISACVGYLVTMRVPKYATNQRKLREMLSVACSAGLSVAFGAPIGGVLFSYEEISTYFPRRVLWRSCLCSMVAAAVLKELNPTGSGKLVLFETNYGVNYQLSHYLVFILLGVCGGLFGGVFCQANFIWSKSFRQLSLIKNSPVFEVAMVTLITALLQYPNRLIRDTGDIVMQRLLVDCHSIEEDWICQQEAKLTGKGPYYAWLISGTFVKLFLTIITFGCKVPSGIIIPAMNAGALFGRMVGQLIPDISPGIFAMVGSAAFLAGVSRMTVSLAVIMFELTGEVNFIPPFMIAILTAKWVADSISAEGVYDLSQHIQGHPFLDSEQALNKVRELRDYEGSATVELLIPPARTMEEITVSVGPSYRVAASILWTKLAHLKARGLTDAGLVFVNERGICCGYIQQSDLELTLRTILDTGECGETDELSLLDGMLSRCVDKRPLSVLARAPLEYAVEIFGKVGVKYLILTEDETAKVVGVVVKKRLLGFLSSLE
ncbi:chloride channel [Thelonectria olida]|uniref:Chloride channel n=1 Tax=Thelonectria olida TaxID=1576542 RepID=A0A9P8VWE3_9HYPO|nr:chloride channel [Thelonectria olida]